MVDPDVSTLLESIGRDPTPRESALQSKTDRRTGAVRVNGRCDYCFRQEIDVTR
jgi:hypothetical protein